MKKLLTTTALALSLAIAAPAIAAPVAPAATPAAKPAAPAAKPASAKGPNAGFVEKGVSQLSEDKQAAFRDSLKASVDKHREGNTKRTQLREELATILGAANFDKAAFTAKNKEIQDEEYVSRANLNTAITEAIAKLSAADRKILADGMMPPKRPAAPAAAKPVAPAAAKPAATPAPAPAAAPAPAKQ
jgi:uncharacterized membrane protein